ncbi:AAA family ATPase [Clostridium sp. DL1XJH146]
MNINTNKYGSDNISKGELIVFVAAKGGVGKTVISVNTAVTIAQKGYSTCILDADFQFGDVNVALNIQPKLTISDMLQDIDSLDNNMLSNYLQKHESGLKILSAPLKPEYAELITPEIIASICNKILEQNKFLVADLGTGLTEHNISFIEKADKVFLITDLEMTTLKNTKIMLKTLKTLDLDDKIKVIVNRGDMESVIKFRDVKDILSLNNLIYISNNFKVVSKSLNIGIPFILNKPKEKITKEINDLANEILEYKKSNKRTRRKKKSFSLFPKKDKGTRR